MTPSEEIFKILADAGINEVYESWYKQDIETPHVIFQQMEERPIMCSEDHYEAIEHVFRFDAFSKDNAKAEELKHATRQALENNGFVWQGTQYEYHSEIEYYHNTTKYIFEEVL